MALILPKGIVVNTPQISGDIERIDKEPLASEELAKFWKVYTTTKRRLCDPTAERLENHWWRIWGSKRRTLNGATVARLFAEISEGQSFVPLHSALERDESGGSHARVLPVGKVHPTSSSTLDSRQQDVSAPVSQAATAAHSPAAMPPPILKKSRGSLASRPRPTARFISPRSSEDEADGYFQSQPPPAELDIKAIHSTPRPRDRQDFAIGEEKTLPGNMLQSNTALPTKSKCHFDNTQGLSSLSSIDEGSNKSQVAGQAKNFSKNNFSVDPKQNRKPLHASGRQQSQSRFSENFSTPAKATVSTLHEDVPLATNNRGSEARAKYDLEASRARHSPDQKMAQNSSGEHSLSTTVDSGSTVFSRSAVDDHGGMDVTIGRRDDTVGLEPPSLFAKRPVPTIQTTTTATSSIANPVDITRSTNNPLSRSKSQLTMLLERDREQREGAHRSSPKTKDSSRP